MQPIRNWYGLFCVHFITRSPTLNWYHIEFRPFIFQRTSEVPRWVGRLSCSLSGTMLPALLDVVGSPPSAQTRYQMKKPSFIANSCPLARQQQYKAFSLPSAIATAADPVVFQPTEENQHPEGIEQWPSHVPAPRRCGFAPIRLIVTTLCRCLGAPDLNEYLGECESRANWRDHRSTAYTAAALRFFIIHTHRAYFCCNFIFVFLPNVHPTSGRASALHYCVFQSWYATTNCCVRDRLGVRHFSGQISERFWSIDCGSTIVSRDVLKWWKNDGCFSP